MFLKLICLTYMLANNYQAGINNLYEGAPHMLSCMSDDNARSTLNRTMCGFFMINL